MIGAILRIFSRRSGGFSDESAGACGEFVETSLRSLEAGGSLPKSLLLEIIETCGASFLDAIYAKPKLSLALAPPLASMVISAKLSPKTLSRAAALLDVAAGAGYVPPAEVAVRLMGSPLTRNRAWRIGLAIFARKPFQVLAIPELAGDKSFARYLRSSLREVELEEAFREALSKRLDFQALLALLLAAGERKAVAFLAPKLLSRGREASLALRLLLAMGAEMRIAAQTPQAAVISLLSGEFPRDLRPEALERALVEVLAAAVFLDGSLPEEAAREAVRRSAIAFAKLARSGEPYTVARKLLSRVDLFLSAAEAWEKHGVLEELAADLKEALGVYALMLYAALLQHRGKGRRASTAAKLANLLSPAPEPSAVSKPLKVGVPRASGPLEAGELDGYSVFIDVSNVIGKRGELSLDDLRGFIEELAERGVEEVVLCYDSNLPWKLFGHYARNKRKLYSAFRQQVFKIEEFARSLGLNVRVLDPAPGQSADELIIEGVERCLEAGGRCAILSNDRYAEYARRYSWLKDERLFIRYRYDGDRLALYRAGRKI
ncbi:MAG: hypothetical protein QXS92_03385 [Thermofilum sp.]